MTEALKQTFKDLLVKLNDHFLEESTALGVYKSVARLERKTTTFLEHISDPSKFKFNSQLEKVLDSFFAEAMDEKSDVNNEHDEINDKLVSLAMNFKKLKKLNSTIIERTVEWKVNSERTVEEIDASPLFAQINEAIQQLKEVP